MNVEYSTEALLRSHLLRVSGIALYAGLPTVPFGTTYGAVIRWLEDGVFTSYAPEEPIHLYEFEASAHINALTLIGLQRYAGEVGGFPIGPPEETYFLTYGYGKAKTALSKGVKTIQGKAYVLLIGVYSEYPAFDIRTCFSGLREEVAGE